MRVKEIEAKSILVKSRLPGCDFVINPYLGCQHSCVYCYARFMKRFTNHKEPWGSFVDVKINALDVLKKQLKKFKGQKEGKYDLLISSVTDPYQQVEKKYKITRNILKTLVDYDCFKVEVLTKSDLVLRDLDILKKLPSLRIICSLGIVDDKIAKFIEPQASLPSKRLVALDKLHQSGLKTTAFISPILPGLTDLEKIFKSLVGKVDEVMAETFNPRGANFTNLVLVLKARFPDLVDDYKKIYFNNYYSTYLKNSKKEFYKVASKYKMPVWGFFTH